MTQMQDLNLFNTEVTDAGLGNLAGLTRMRKLSLGRYLLLDLFMSREPLARERLARLQPTANITDAGMAQLGGLTQLQELDLFNTRVTDAGIASFEHAHPAAKVLLRQ
jgi:internalin A